MKQASDKMIEFVKKSVADYFNRVHLNDTKYIGMMTPDDVFIVWFSKSLQNFKACASYHYWDKMYYEITYNGDKKEAYLDCYKKVDNVKIPFDLNANGY